METALLAAVREYMFWWQAPLFLAFVAGWIFGGGYLLRRVCLNRDYDERKIRHGRAYLIMTLSGSAAGFAGGVVFFLLRSIGTALGVQLLHVGTIAAILVSLPAAYLIFYVMLEFPAGKVLKTSLLPLASVYILGVITVIIAGLPAREIRQTNLKKRACMAHVRDITKALMDYEAKFGRPAPSLETLVEKSLLQAEDLRLELTPTSDNSFTYAIASFRGRPDPKKIILASRKIPDLDGRAVLFATREASWKDEEDFQKLLRRSINKDIAKADKMSGD